MNKYSCKKKDCRCLICLSLKPNLSHTSLLDSKLSVEEYNPEKCTILYLKFSRSNDQFERVILYRNVSESKQERKQIVTRQTKLDQSNRPVDDAGTAECFTSPCSEYIYPETDIGDESETDIGDESETDIGGESKTHIDGESMLCSVQSIESPSKLKLDNKFVVTAELAGKKTAIMQKGTFWNFIILLNLKIAFFSSSNLIKNSATLSVKKPMQIIWNFLLHGCFLLWEKMKKRILLENGLEKHKTIELFSKETQPDRITLSTSRKSNHDPFILHVFINEKKKLFLVKYSLFQTLTSMVFCSPVEYSILRLMLPIPCTPKNRKCKVKDKEKKGFRPVKKQLFFLSDHFQRQTINSEACVISDDESENDELQENTSTFKKNGRVHTKIPTQCRVSIEHSHFGYDSDSTDVPIVGVNPPIADHISFEQPGLVGNSQQVGHTECSTEEKMEFLNYSTEQTKCCSSVLSPDECVSTTADILFPTLVTKSFTSDECLNANSGEIDVSTSIIDNEPMSELSDIHQHHESMPCPFAASIREFESKILSYQNSRFGIPFCSSMSENIGIELSSTSEVEESLLATEKLLSYDIEMNSSSTISRVPHQIQSSSSHTATTLNVSKNRKKLNFVPRQREIFLLKTHNQTPHKETKSKVFFLSECDDDSEDLPTTAQEKIRKRRRKRLSKNSHKNTYNKHVSAELEYFDDDSSCDDSTDVPVNGIVTVNPPTINHTSFEQLGLVGNSRQVGHTECSRGSKIVFSNENLVFVKDFDSTQQTFKTLMSVKYRLPTNKSLKSCLERGPRGKKVVRKVLTSFDRTKPIEEITTETSYDHARSLRVGDSLSQQALYLVKTMKKYNTELAGIPSHDKLRQASIGSLDQSTSSVRNTTAQQDLKATSIKSPSFPLASPNETPANATKTATESSVKRKRLSNSKPVQADGACRQIEKPSTNIKLQVASPNETETETPHQTQVSNSTRHSKHISNESATSVQHSLSLRRSQEWISTTTKLLHVPDYSKMIQFLNEVTPASDDIIAHRFIRGIAYFKVGKFRQAMTDLHEAETVAVEKYEQKTSSDGSFLDSGIYSLRSLEPHSGGARLPNVPIRGSRGDIALCNVYMGDLHYSSASYREASKCYQRAAEFYEHDCVARLFRMIPPSLSTIHSKCGSCLRNQSKSMQAIQEYRNAIKAAVRDKDRLTAYTSLGNLLQSLGQNKEALVEYKCALELAEELNDYLSIGWTNGNIGNCYLGMLEKDKALHHLQKALDITIEHEPKPESIGRAYNNIGTAYQSMGDLDRAEKFYDLALSQSIYGNDLAGQARVYGNIGNIFIVRKNFEKAIPHYTEVLRLSKDSATIATAQHNRGCAYYEWAETKMLTLEKSLAKSSPTTSDDPVFRIHGSKSILPSEHSPRIVIDSIAQLFKDGMTDLQKVVQIHEGKLDHIKGSSKGLSLSVSLTESNSRTFHRLQECMVALGNWREALLIADQCRSRTLGEIMLSKKQSQIEIPLTSPVAMQHIYSIVGSQNSPVLYLSHTGFRLLGWVLVPLEDSLGVNMEMFEVPLSDDQFDGKSFDYHIRYGLTEVLVEKSYEMYRSMDYSEENTVYVSQLYKLIGKPLKMILERLYTGKKSMQKIILITDTYTSLLPFTCLYDSESGTFLGDQFYFESMLSFLTMGIMSQLPEPIVELPGDQHNMCIVGNPVIPKFYHNDEVWSLGSLPYARREAQWVGHILNTPPILDEQATKNAVMMRFMRAKIIHIATHGSSISGFLAFAALTATRSGEVIDSSGVLLHPEEVEQLSISPALVVLSSCDSSRGTVKADGVQGMARAFLLAGAQAVLTALWKVPDESAAVFMRFFYRFLGLGFESSLALQKSILSLRCFSKYSQYIHWSGYQLTGRSIRLDVKPSPVATIFEYTLSPSSPFPRLMLVKKLEGVLVDNPRLPTDIQILHGSPGVKPSEVVIDFIHSCHHKFAAGIFWICCRTPETIDASLNYIEKIVKKPLIELRMSLSETQQSLIVLDNTIELPTSERLTLFMKHSNVHIIILSKLNDSLDSLIKEVDKLLLRGCTIHEVKTLSTIDSTQRIVYKVMQQHYLKASNNDQAIFEKLAEFTSGSPLIVDIATQVLLKFIQEHSDEPSDALQKFGDSIHLSKSRKKCFDLSSNVDNCFRVRAISDQLTRLVPEIATKSSYKDVWESESEYDSWDSLAELLKLCVSSPGEMLLLRALAIFGCIPIPLPLVTAMSSLVAKATGHSHLSGIFHERLMEAKLLLQYPHPVVLHSSLTKTNTANKEPLFLYLPQHLANQLWTCDNLDQIMAISIAHKALQKCIEKDSEVIFFYLGLFPPLEEKASSLLSDGKKCYEAVYQSYLQLSHQLYHSHPQ